MVLDRCLDVVGLRGVYKFGLVGFNENSKIQTLEFKMSRFDYINKGDY